MYSIPKQAQTLFNLYLFHHNTSSFHRTEFSKKITAYNKANKADKDLRISSGMLIKDRFPSLFSYVSSLYPSVPEDELFENNFKKLIVNLHILPSVVTRTHSYNQKTYNVYKSLEPSLIVEAYRKLPVKLYNSVTDKVYELSGHNFKSLDGEDAFYHGDLQYILSCVREV